MFRVNPVPAIARVALRSKEAVGRNRPLVRLLSTVPELAAVAPNSVPYVNNAVNIPIKEAVLELGKEVQVAKIVYDETPQNSPERSDADLIRQRQIRIETEQLQEAAQMYTHSFKHLSHMGKGTTIKSTQRLLLAWYEPLLDVLNTEIHCVLDGAAAPDRNHYGPYLAQIDTPKLAVVTLTSTINSILRCGNDGVRIHTLANEIVNVIEAEARLQRMKGDNKAPLWQKRLAMEQPVSVRALANLNAKMRKVANEEDWEPQTKMKLGCFLINALINATKVEGQEAPFVHDNNYYASSTAGQAWRKGYVRMNPRKYEEFVKLSSKDGTLAMPRYLPMLIQPGKWDNRVYTGAYLSMKAQLMKTMSSQQTKAVKSADMPRVLESLDYLGQMAWRINPVVHNVIVQAVEQKLEIADLPSRENMKRPDQAEARRTVQELIAETLGAIEKFDRIAVEQLEKKRQTVSAAIEKLQVALWDSKASPKVLEKRREEVEQLEKQLEELRRPQESTQMQTKLKTSLEKLLAQSPEEIQFDDRRYKYMCNRIDKRNGELHSLRSDVDIKLKIAKQFQDDVMYFPHNIDFRGRAYPIPPNLSHMGNDFCRGIMKFEKAKPLGEEGFRWLKIHLCNLFGHNKVSMDERAGWVDAHMDEVRDSAERPLEGRRWWLQAEGPFQALAACAEIIAAIDSGNPATFASALPVHQDGSCNGLQHYAGLGRDAQGGASVNLVPHATPQDVYSGVLVKVLEKLEVDARLSSETEDLERSPGARARRLLGHVNRKVIKQTVMTSVYGVTKIGARAQVEARLREAYGLDAATITPEKEREISVLAGYLANLTLTSLNEMFVSANAIMEWLGECAKLIAKENQPVAWVTPLGLPVMQPYRKARIHSVSTVMQTVALAVSSDHLPISTRKQKSAFPPNFVHSMDATHMMMTSLRMKEHGLSFAAVHDSYWTHACDIPIMSKFLREAFVELYSMPLLEDLRDSFVMRFPDVEFPEIPQRGNLDIQLVKESRYFFH